MRLSLPLLMLSVAAAGLCRGDDHEAAYRLRERQDILPLEELLRRAHLGADARILEIEREVLHGRHVYEIEYVDGNGRIREILIDASDGKILSEEEEN